MRDTKTIGQMMSKIELTDIQRRNLEILVFDALFYIKKKRHSLTEDEVNELSRLNLKKPKKDSFFITVIELLDNSVQTFTI